LAVAAGAGAGGGAGSSSTFLRSAQSLDRSR
jgi:hypothetical protein